MIRRVLPILAPLIAVIFILGSAVPVAAYNAEGRFQLRLTRLDPVECNQPIRIRAKLTDKNGAPVVGRRVKFEFKTSKRRDSLSTSSVITDSSGRAITIVTLACNDGKRVLKVTGPNKASAQITFTLKRHHSKAAAAVVSNVGPGGTGSASVVTAPLASVNTSSVSSMTGSSAALVLLSIVPTLFGLMVLRAYRRRPPRTLIAVSG